MFLKPLGPRRSHPFAFLLNFQAPPSAERAVNRSELLLFAGKAVRDNSCQTCLRAPPQRRAAKKTEKGRAFWERGSEAQLYYKYTGLGKYARRVSEGKRLLSTKVIPAHRDRHHWLRTAIARGVACSDF